MLILITSSLHVEAKKRAQSRDKDDSECMCARRIHVAPRLRDRNRGLPFDTSRGIVRYKSTSFNLVSDGYVFHIVPCSMHVSLVIQARLASWGCAQITRNRQATDFWSTEDSCFLSTQIHFRRNWLPFVLIASLASYSICNAIHPPAPLLFLFSFPFLPFPSLPISLALPSYLRVLACCQASPRIIVSFSFFFSPLADSYSSSFFDGCFPGRLICAIFVVATPGNLWLRSGY